jgi:hypothetical protein
MGFIEHRLFNVLILKYKKIDIYGFFISVASGPANRLTL